MAPQGKVALITGAAQGLGRSIALRLASDGCNVLINDLASNSQNLDKVADEIRSTAGKKVVTFLGDVSVEEVVKDMVQKAVDEFGGLDVVRFPDHGFGKSAESSSIDGGECWCRSYQPSNRE